MQTHDQNQRAINMTSFLPVSALTRDIFMDSSQITLTSTSGFGNNGYVLIGNDIDNAEVVGYISRRGNTIAMPEHKGGIFRGMFGTDKLVHKANELCYAIPYDLKPDMLRSATRNTYKKVDDAQTFGITYTPLKDAITKSLDSSSVFV